MKNDILETSFLEAENNLGSEHNQQDETIASLHESALVSEISQLK